MAFDDPPPLGERIYAMIEPAQLMAWAMSRKWRLSGALQFHHCISYDIFAFLYELGACLECLRRRRARPVSSESASLLPVLDLIIYYPETANDEQTISACVPKLSSGTAKFSLLFWTRGGSVMSLLVDSGSNSPVCHYYPDHYAGEMSASTVES